MAKDWNLGALKLVKPLDKSNPDGTFIRLKIPYLLENFLDTYKAAQIKRLTVKSVAPLGLINVVDDPKPSTKNDRIDSSGAILKPSKYRAIVPITVPKNKSDLASSVVTPLIPKARNLIKRTCKNCAGSNCYGSSNKGEKGKACPSKCINPGCQLADCHGGFVILCKLTNSVLQRSVQKKRKVKSEMDIEVM
jgi:hypothetical protein